jgi:(1->4)-alpha-D-glucan 1-alpha-D-glucosylmutase
MISARVPGATYRIQFNQGFQFVDGRDLIPYLSDLGITDLYSSPQYKARRGSSHGYDIANPLRVNSELGTEEDFDEMAGKLQNYGMGLLLDTVPNHMAASYENPWWMDVLENGRASAFADYFDIDWRPKITKAAFLQDNKILLPVLGDLYGNVLDNGQISLKFEDTGISARYYETRLPLDPRSYSGILKRCGEFADVGDLIRELENLPDRDDDNPERIKQRRREKDRVKERLWRFYNGTPEFKQILDEALLQIVHSPDALHELLSQQAYRLAYWKIGYEEINYRRFFDINDLVALRVEVPEVFERRHQKILELVKSGKVTGLRIDHIDGLWDPNCYLRRLQGQSGGQFYIVVEKILGRTEELPTEWPVGGTTGYDFLNALNGIFVEPAGFGRLEEEYARRTGMYLPFAEVCYRSNKLVMEKLFPGDVNALGRHLGVLAAHHRQARDIRISELRELLVETTACLPVYRTYIHDFAVTERDRDRIERTLALARRRTSTEAISDAAFAFVRSVLLLEPPAYLEERKRDWLQFVMRWQQFTGPVMAKGLEDTAAYRHNSLLSVNDVGSDPVREQLPFDLEAFHEFSRARLRDWPETMNATTTHDTKRSEDVRARLNVLTEIPDEWEARLNQWVEWNLPLKSNLGGVLVPAIDEEILIYQTMLGAWPHREEDHAEFPARLKEFLRKALREAKQNSSWIGPNEAYEQAVEAFVDRILASDSQFLADFGPFQREVAVRGARNGLSQLLLKICVPGVPDFYQGMELWEFTLVDPDNRRPVDYKRRATMLETLRAREVEDRIALVRDLAADPLRDEMKMWVTSKTLHYRRAHAELFARGEYQALEARGPQASRVCAFARRLNGQWVVVVAPRWAGGVQDWGDTEIVLPEGAPTHWQDRLTCLFPGSFMMKDLLAEFPVALLASVNPE